MNETLYLNSADLLTLHEAIMVRTGTAPANLRDEGLLESAMMRAQNAAYYEEADLVRQGVMLAVGISQAQAFTDGNKRTAFVACDVFLRLNGLAFCGDPLGLAKQLEAVAAPDLTRDLATDQFEAWLRDKVR